MREINLDLLSGKVVQSVELIDRWNIQCQVTFEDGTILVIGAIRDCDVWVAAETPEEE